MEWLVPFLPLFGALPIAVAAVVIAWLWRRRRDESAAGADQRNQDLRQELDALRREAAETQERLDFAERILAQRGRSERLPDPPPGG